MSFSPSGVTDSMPTSAPSDAGLSHRVEKRRVFRGLHGDLRVEDHVGRQLREAGHQLEPFRPDRLELLEPVWILTAGGHREILEGHRVEVVVG